MARMSIYVPDDMKVRMDQAGEINWSNVAQAAFGAAMVRNTFNREPIMEDVIERLRASKIEHEELEISDGKADGRGWAMKVATFAQLKLIGETDAEDYPGDDDSLHLVFERLIGENETDIEAKMFYDPSTEQFFSDVYVTAFWEGATEVWEEVKSKL